MLSYQHGFHAGNHPDILKHVVLTTVLSYVIQKDKPLVYIDTHAGRGIYDLTAAQAQKTGEYNNGIGKLWNNSANPPELTNYLQLVASFNAASSARLYYYPGSPALASQLLRHQDRLILFEAHPAEFTELSACFATSKTVAKHASTSANIRLNQADGLQGLIAVLPPKEKRGVILIDPSYEIKTDYKLVSDTIEQAYKRFATGIYLIWYPLISGNNYSQRLIKSIKNSINKSAGREVLVVELQISKPSAEIGLYGSGMLIINPPYILEKTLAKLLPYLVSTLTI